jgi:acyl transferase domain-containing protein/acyl carrier protein
VDELVQKELAMTLDELWEGEAAQHRGPWSPLLTFVGQICLADLWRRWGYEPDVVAGHSTGELAASFEAGLYSLDDVFHIAIQIGQVAARLEGQMVHGVLSEGSIESLPLHLSSFNFPVGTDKHVTLCGYAEEVERFVADHPDFVRMKLPHPWHHPDYGRFIHELESVPSCEATQCQFVSSVTAQFETRLDEDHWRRWLTDRVDFVATLEQIREQVGDEPLDVVEIGFHPVLQKSLVLLNDVTAASSMARGEDSVPWILHNRRKLSSGPLEEALKRRISTFRPHLSLNASLSYQGLDSLDFTQLAEVLEPYFPGLTPQDFYRHTTVRQLVERYGTVSRASTANQAAVHRHDVVVAGMSCRLPSEVETVSAFWKVLSEGGDQVTEDGGRGRAQAGYLNAHVSRFDHQFFNISQAEASTMDPQQILSLELAEMLWRDAGIDPATLDRSRVGVYLGVWNEEYRGDGSSVYAPTGTNPSIIASRISYHYDLRGPSWVSNTACSSSLVAVHYAAKDIEAGRVDYAIAGGVNMLLDESVSDTMRNAGFLSPDDRCKTFADGANGYVRAEGGGLVLLANRDLVGRHYASLAGSSINQNGGRSQVLTAPHPEAQEELIRAACQDAAIDPRELVYIECHGTGTKLGDPIEISALHNTVGRNRERPCYIGSVKSNIGHLESAAGIAGLIKAIAALNQGTIPPNLHFDRPNQFIDFESSGLHVVTTSTPIGHEDYVGVSSFGFGGSNAHVVVRGAGAENRKEISELEVPFDRSRAAPLERYLRRADGADGSLQKVSSSSLLSSADQTLGAREVVTRDDINSLVTELFFQLTDLRDIDPELELSEQGLDSLSGTQLITKLEQSLNIEVEPEFIFENPLIDQFVDGLFELTGGSASWAGQRQASPERHRGPTAPQ